MNLSEMVGHKLATEGNHTKSNFMNMRKFSPGDRLGETHVSQGAENPGAIDTLIQGLVDLLPKRDGIWPLQERAKWLRIAAGIFDLGYKAGNGEHGEINIVIVKQDLVNRPRVAVREQAIVASPSD
jgi:hypothetical protein